MNWEAMRVSKEAKLEMGKIIFEEALTNLVENETLRSWEPVDPQTPAQAHYVDYFLDDTGRREDESLIPASYGLDLREQLSPDMHGHYELRIRVNAMVRGKGKQKTLGAMMMELTKGIEDYRNRGRVAKANRLAP